MTVSAPTRPLWIPEKVPFDTVLPGLPQAIIALVNPASEERVLGVRMAIERTQGFSLVGLFSWDLIHPFNLGEAWAREQPSNGEKELRCYLQLVGLKDMVAHFVREPQKFHVKVGATGPRGRAANAEEGLRNWKISNLWTNNPSGSSGVWPSTRNSSPARGRSARRIGATRGRSSARSFFWYFE